MGSGLDKIGEDYDLKCHEEKVQFINNTIKKIENIRINSYEFEDFKWLVENRTKIIRNRQLIDLIG